VPRNDLIQLRSDTAANWASVNPTLAIGETGFETDTGKLKVGTGSTAWSSLLYVTDASDLAGVIPSARISGSYTGITAVNNSVNIGTLGNITTDAYAVVLSNTNYPTLTTRIGEHYTVSGVGTANNDFTVFSNQTVRIKYVNNTVATFNSTGLSVVGQLTVSGNIGLSSSTGAFIATANTPDAALPWAQGPVLQGQTGWSFFQTVSGSYRMGFRGNSAGTTKYMWSADNVLIGAQPNDSEVTNTLNVMGTGRFTSTVTAPTFSGNATTATNLSTNSGNWSTNGTISAVVGQLVWKHYGNGHTIFDASQSTSPSGGAVNNTNPQINWSSTYPTLMGWNGLNTYGVRVDSARTSDNTTGNAATATTAGSSNTLKFVSSIFWGQYSTFDAGHTGQALQGGYGGAAAGMALWASGVAPQFRVGASSNTVYLQNADNSVAVSLHAYIIAPSSANIKQDIGSFPLTLRSAGAAVNEDEILTGLNIVRQLRPVNYRWKEELHFAQLPSDPRRVMALSRLNKIRSSKGLEPYQSDELRHDCARDNCKGTAENPCPWTKNWEIGNIGFIAQEVGAVIPQATSIDNDGEYSGLDNLALTAIAVASIKELDATVQSLTERIKQLEESNV